MYTTDIGNKLIELGKLLKELPTATLIELDNTLEEGLHKVAKHITESLEKLQTYQEEIDSYVQKVVDKADKGAQNINESVAKLNRKLNKAQWEFISPDIYKLKELLDLCDRCNRYTDKEWQRIAHFAALASNAKDGQK